MIPVSWSQSFLSFGGYNDDFAVLFEYVGAYFLELVNRPALFVLCVAEADAYAERKTGVQVMFHCVPGQNSPEFWQIRLPYPERKCFMNNPNYSQRYRTDSMGLETMTVKHMTTLAENVPRGFAWTPVSGPSLLAILLFASPVSAQPMPERVTVKGCVKVKDSDKPVQGAAVVINLLDAKGARKNRTLPVAGMSGTPTDGQGRFVIRGVPEGKYWVNIAAKGYKTFGQQVEITPRAPLDLDVELAPHLPLTFRILAPGGAPAAGKPVQIAMVVPRWHRSSSKSNKEGDFRLSCACKPTRLLARVPGVGSGNIQLNPKKLPNEPLPIQLEKDGTVSGVVKDKVSGKPVAGFKVYAASVAGLGKRPSIAPHPPIAAKTDAGGRFVLRRVPPGACAVSMNDKRALQAVPVKLDLSPGQAANDLEFGIFIAPKLKGRLLGVSGRPMATARTQTLRMWVRQADGKHKHFSSQVSVDTAGRFQLYAMGLGSTLMGVAIANEGWGYSSRVDITTGSDHETDIQLKPFLSLAGKVLDADTGAPITGANVKVTPSKSPEPSLAALADVHANRNGEFVATNLVPSLYNISVSAFGYAAPRPVKAKVTDQGSAPEVIVKLKKATSPKR